MFIIDRQCHNLVVATPVKYVSDAKSLAYIYAKSEICLMVKFTYEQSSSYPHLQPAVAFLGNIG